MYKAIKSSTKICIIWKREKHSLQVASCTFYQFGSAGMQVRLNALCILTLNILVDKVPKVLLMEPLQIQS